MSRTAIYAVLFAVIAVTHADVWSPSSLKDGANIYVCEGSDVTFDWSYIVSNGDEIIDIEWYYQFQNGTKEFIAGLIQGQFFTHQDRLHYVPTAGLKVTAVTPADTGSYIVKVNYRNSTGHSAPYNRTAHFQLSLVPEVAGGHLHGQRTPGAVQDFVTGEWVAQLECSHFLNVGNPPISVEWTKTCEDMNSTLVEIDNAAENQFVLSLVNDSGVVASYIGVNDIATEGVYVYSSSGKPVNYTNWESHEPNNMGETDCAFLCRTCYYSYGPNEWHGQWNDVSCYERGSFTCEYSLL